MFYLDRLRSILTNIHLERVSSRRTEFYLIRVFISTGFYLVRLSSEIYRNFCVEQDYIQILRKLFGTRILVGFYCGKCLSCKHSFTSRKSVHFYSQNRDLTLKLRLCCLETNVVYIIECRRCLLQYGGSTEQKYSLRCDQWRSDIKINSKLSQVI